MKVVIFQKYIESKDDTEFAIFVLDKKRDLTAYVQYLCNRDDNYSQKLAVNCSDEKFQTIIDMKRKSKKVELLLLNFHVSTEKEADKLINQTYSKTRIDKGLESGWFNGHSI